MRKCLSINQNAETSIGVMGKGDEVEVPSLQTQRPIDRYGIIPPRRKQAKATVHRLTPVAEFKVDKEKPQPPYRDAVCELCERTVSLALDVPLQQLRAKTRLSPDIAFARQIAMYLAHTIFGLDYTDVGLHFRRDRTTVSHACRLVEDRREEMTIDVMLEQLSALLEEAKNAVSAAQTDCLRDGYCVQGTVS